MTRLTEEEINEIERHARSAKGEVTLASRIALIEALRNAYEEIDRRKEIMDNMANRLEKL